MGDGERHTREWRSSGGIGWWPFSPLTLSRWEEGFYHDHHFIRGS
jgi:hypothetical protein